MEEHKSHEHNVHHKKKFKLPKLKRFDKIAILVLIIFVILVAIPVYKDKGDCEVARPGYKCESAKNVMIEHCEYWGQYNCDTDADVSLPQVVWYIENLCELHNEYHDAGLSCANLQTACNQVSGQSLC